MTLCVPYFWKLSVVLVASVFQLSNLPVQGEMEQSFIATDARRYAKHIRAKEIEMFKNTH